jgi:hypothetical protein
VSMAPRAMLIRDTHDRAAVIVDPRLTMIGCDNVHPLNDKFYIVWIPIIIFDFFLCCLSIYKVLEHSESSLSYACKKMLTREYRAR